MSKLDTFRAELDGLAFQQKFQAYPVPWFYLQDGSIGVSKNFLKINHGDESGVLVQNRKFFGKMRPF